MKKLTLLFYLISVSLSSSAQTWEEWWKQKDTQKRYLAEQIAALKAYGAVLKSGYETVSQGLYLVHQIQDDDYTQHESYFGSFSSVKTQVKNHPEAEMTINLHSKILSLTQRFLTSNSESGFTKSEERLIIHVILAIQKDSNELLKELQILLKNDLYQLSDSERINQLRQIQSSMKEVYGFTAGLIQDCLQISKFRQRELQSIQSQKSFSYPNHTKKP